MLFRAGIAFANLVLGHVKRTFQRLINMFKVLLYVSMLQTVQEAYIIGYLAPGTRSSVSGTLQGKTRESVVITVL